MDAALQKVAAAVRRNAPDLIDDWEATAWVESFGWTDERVKAALALPDTRTLGRRVFELSDGISAPAADVDVDEDDTDESTALIALLGTYSRTLIYAFPWLVMFAAEAAWPSVLDTRPEMAGPISVAVMLSLIATGGYVQAIARKGSFYLGMQQVILARHVGLLLCRVGLITIGALTVLGLLLGGYFDVFGSTWARVIAAFYFVMLATLWLACAMASLVPPRWRVPVVYLGAGTVFVTARAFFEASTLDAYTIALIVAVALASVLTHEAFRTAVDSDRRTERVVLPRTAVLLHSLVPHFTYGVAYFTFLFADRLSAGSALPAISGLAFGISGDYKRGIDLAFLVFLLVAGAVEAINVLLMQAWRSDAREGAPGAPPLARALRRRRRIALCLIAATFGTFAIAAAALAIPDFLSPESYGVFVAGCLGYGLFSLGLLDALLLFSINRPGDVLRALLPALGLNLVSGYACSHVIGAQYAVVGLVLGAAWFAWRTASRARAAMRQPDFAYAWA